MTFAVRLVASAKSDPCLPELDTALPHGGEEEAERGCCHPLSTTSANDKKKKKHEH